jgi:hypothetical protein
MQGHSPVGEGLADEDGSRLKRVELTGGWGVLSGRGWTMYCDRCGTQLTSGGQYCMKCGKAILGGGAATSSTTGRGMGQVAGPAGAYGAAATSDGRVRRNLRTLATLWMINGILRLAGAGSMIIFGGVFLPFLRGWRGPGAWPVGGWGLDSFLSRGVFSVGVVLAMFGVLHLVLAWSLFECESWARMLGLVMGFLALLRFPLGTALGIYTLWVLLPESSGAEYDRLAQGDGQLNSAAVSS